MIRQDCIYNDSDEDCGKCVKHGFIFGCEGCEDYENFCGYGLNGKKKEKGE